MILVFVAEIVVVVVVFILVIDFTKIVLMKTDNVLITEKIAKIKHLILKKGQLS